MTQKIKTLFAFVLFFISSLALFATFYTIYIWGDIYFEQILVALDDGTAAVGDNIVNSYVYFTFIPAAILTFVVISCIFSPFDLEYKPEPLIWCVHVILLQYFSMFGFLNVHFLHLCPNLKAAATLFSPSLRDYTSAWSKIDAQQIHMC